MNKEEGLATATTDIPKRAIINCDYRLLHLIFAGQVKGRIVEENGKYEIKGLEEITIGDNHIKIELDENMPEDEILLRFPKGQKNKNIRIINIGVM